MSLEIHEMVRLARLLDEALELPPDRREAWLAGLDESNAHLRETLSRLFRSELQRETSDFLNTLPSLSLQFDCAASSDDFLHAGTTVAAYELIREIGRGGMGTVWLANRRDKLINRPVALKLPHLAAHDPASADRFAREREILAALTHPNIARLYDAGVSDRGQPFLAMEYIEGQPILQYCDERRVAVTERLRLFIQVVAAVQYAHTQLIVHRDIKPSNILVASSGHVCLLDFGIAKLIADDNPLSRQLTQIAGPALTPSYASPEQIANKPLGTASDVYSLAVVLYELLTGALPYRCKRSSRAVLEEAILSADPVKPSQAANDAKAAVARSTSARKLSRSIRGDLDTILLKALRKSPAERYVTAQALADDIERYLQKRPVVAQADSAIYRASKFIRRNKGSVSALAGGFIAVAVGIVLISWQARVAQSERLRAERVKNFVISVFQARDPFLTSSAAARTGPQLIADAAQRLDAELSRDPTLHAELLDVLGEIALDLDDLAGANALLQRAVHERTERFGPRSPQVAQSLTRLAAALYHLGRYAEAEKADREALAILRAHKEANPIEVARTERELGKVLGQARGASPESDDLLHQALSTFDRYLGPDDVNSVRTLMILAEQHQRERNVAQAEPEIREVIRRAERGAGPDSRLAAYGQLLLGDIERQAHRYTEALDSYLRATATLRAQEGPKSTYLANALVHTAFAQKGLRRFHDALLSYQEAQAATPESDLIGHCDVLLGRGNVELLIGQLQDAERDIHEAYLKRSNNPGEKTTYTWVLAAEWGRALAANGRFGEAEQIQRQALAQFTALAGSNAYLLVTIDDDLAGTLEDTGRAHGEATQLRRRIMQVVSGKYSNTHLLWAEYALKLARNLTSYDSPQSNSEGLALSEQAATDFRGSPADTELLAEALTEHSEFLRRRGDGVAARQEALEALELLDRTAYPDMKALKRARSLERRLPGL